jgi:hypothetical protein
MEQFPTITVVIVLFVVIILFSAIKILREYERGVIFRLTFDFGTGAKGPGSSSTPVLCC